MGGRVLPKSMMNIDGGDVMNLAAGLAGIHEVEVEWTTIVRMRGISTSLDITVLAWVPAPTAHQVKEVARVQGIWPDKEHRGLDAYLFALLYELDRAIGKAYDQKGLTE